MTERWHLAETKAVAAEAGFRCTDTGGNCKLIDGTLPSPVNSLNLVFSGEQIFPGQMTPHPPLRPTRQCVRGVDVMVIALEDLIRTKLITNRLEDKVHIQDLDNAGLITPELERLLTPELAERLRYIREHD